MCFYNVSFPRCCLRNKSIYSDFADPPKVLLWLRMILIIFLKLWAGELAALIAKLDSLFLSAFSELTAFTPAVLVIGATTPAVDIISAEIFPQFLRILFGQPFFFSTIRSSACYINQTSGAILSAKSDKYPRQFSSLIELV